MKNQQQKQYKFYFLDKKGNELMQSVSYFYSKKDAIKYAHYLHSTSNLNDLHKVKSKLC